MERGQAFRISSARVSSPNIWRIGGETDVFWRRSSAKEENDEEALTWIALEKLPTYLRIQRGILTEGEGLGREIEVQSLEIIERRNLLERLLKDAEEDNEKFLMKLKQRIERVGLNLPTIEVRFGHLNMEAGAYEGSRALPTIFNFTMNLLERFLNSLCVFPSRKKSLPILNDVSGIVRPGRMTLLLGPPGSGKTMLLQALAGKLGKDLKASTVTYNGHGVDEFIPERTSAYISQYDLHIGVVPSVHAGCAQPASVSPRASYVRFVLRLLPNPFPPRGAWALQRRKDECGSAVSGGRKAAKA